MNALEELEDSVFQRKREVYMRCYGICQPDGSREKIDVRVERVWKEISKEFETK